LTSRLIRRIDAFITEMVGPVGKSYLYEIIIPIIEETHTERTEARKIHLSLWNRLKPIIAGITRDEKIKSIPADRIPTEIATPNVK
jgi:hypothetical protein